MLKLVTQKDSRWLDLDISGAAVRIKVRPLSTAVMKAAQAEAVKRARALRMEADAQEKAGFALDPTAANINNPHWREGLIGQFLAEALLRYGAEAWEGVGDASGATLPLEASSIEAFAAHERAAEAFVAAYLAPLEAVAAEGNVCAPSSPGAGGEGANTAPDATQTAPTVPLS